MSAYVDHEFDKGFILDEVRIRKLHEIIEVRLKKLPDSPKLKLKVFRGDSLSYETDDVGVVVNEDNDDWRAVTRIDFIAEAPDVFGLRLTFSGKRVAINITGDDRDAVFLLFSDVRDYLNNEVLSGVPLGRDSARVISLLIMMVAMVVAMWSVVASTIPNQEALQAALSSESVSDKLDFLIEERSKRSPGPWSFAGLVLMAFAMLLTIGGFLESLWRFFFPTNLFLFGTRKQTFERRQSTKSKVFWGVFVALLVSVLGGLILAGWLPRG